MRNVAFTGPVTGLDARAKPQVERRRGLHVTAVLSAAHGVNDAYTAILPALLPLLGLRFGLSEMLLSLLVAAFSFSTSLPAPFLGALSDKLEPRLMTALGIALTAVPLSLIGTAPTAAILFLLVIISGLGSAALHPAGSALARTAGQRGAALAVGLFSAGGMIGYAAGPLLILAVVAQSGLESMPWLIAPGLFAAGAVYLILPQERQAAGKPASLGFDAGLFIGPVGMLTLAGTLGYLPFLAFISALPIWLVQEHGIAPDHSLIGVTLAVFSIAGAAGGVATGLLSVRVRRSFLIPGTMLLAIGPLLAVLHAVPGSGLFWVALVLAGAMTYGSAPLLVVSAQDLAPHATAAASGMLTGMSAGLAAILYIGAGWLQGEIGISAALGVASLILIPGAALSYRVLSKHPRPERAGNAERATDLACACLSAGPLGLPGSCTSSTRRALSK